MPNNEYSTPPAESCIDCGVPIIATVGGIAICGNCLAVRGACCAESATDESTARTTGHAIHHNRARCQFSTAIGAKLDYRFPTPGEMEITHTFTPESARGQGLAARLMNAAIAYATTEKLKLKASCSYARHYIQGGKNRP